MLIVVVMLGILATIAGVGYRRYVGRARVTEAVAMVSEIASKQTVYYSEFASYLPLRKDDKPPVGMTGSDANEPAAQFFPRDPSNTAFESVRTTALAPSVDGSTWTSWRRLGITFKDTNLYCTYFSNAGAINTRPAANTLGERLLNSQAAAVPQPWFYVVGSCNLNGAAGFPAEVSSFGMTNTRPTLIPMNEGK